jgi:uncharacterized damage-inducible protein DinB
MEPQAGGPVREAVAQQFGAALETIARALEACPEDRWWSGPTPSAFGYIVFHALFWTDYYLADLGERHVPPPPYTLGELDPAGVPPDRPYTKEELRAFLRHTRARLAERLGALSLETAARPARTRPAMGELELLLYNLRHVQHHAGQLQLLLRQAGLAPPPWVSRAPQDAT